MLDNELERLLKELSNKKDGEGKVMVSCSDYNRMDLQSLAEMGLVETTYYPTTSEEKCMVTFTYDGNNYFREKSIKRKQNICEWIRWVILVIIGVVTIIVTILNS